MKRKLCLIPSVSLAADFILIYLDDQSSFICSDIDDDSSAMSKSCDLLREIFGISCGLQTMNNFRYLGDIQYNGEVFSIIHFALPKNHSSNCNKKSVVFAKSQKEYSNPIQSNSAFNVDDSFALAVGLKLLSF